MGLEFLLTMVRSRAFISLFKLSFEKIQKGPTRIIRVSGPLVFTNLLTLKRLIQEAHQEADLIELDLTSSSFIDHTVRDFLESEKKYLQSSRTNLEIELSKRHKAVGAHELSAQVLKRTE